MHEASSQNLGPASGRPVPLLTSAQAQRFWAKVEKTHDCWLWTASLGHSGYGQFGAFDTVWPSHRIAYRQLIGPIEAGLTLDHLCRNKRCVNPAHLEPVTHHENTTRAASHARDLRTHCKHGHEFTPENTYIRSDGSRQCKTCRRATQKRWYTRHHHPWAILAVLSCVLIVWATLGLQAGLAAI